MKPRNPRALAVNAPSLPMVASADEEREWTFETALYGYAAGMQGDVTAKGISADLNVDFGEVLENLEFGAMGMFRTGYRHGSLTTDVIYMGLGASKGGFDADLDQWIVETAVGYRVRDYFEPLVGVRYNNIAGELGGPLGQADVGTQDWVEPFLGANLFLPLWRDVGFRFRGDAGGFGAGADLTWQAFPHLVWKMSERWSLQAGYRWVSTDYETGGGRDYFKYDVLSQGPQLGFTCGF